jgi:predicted transcriptional regulator
MNESYKELSKAQSRTVCHNLGKLTADLKITHEALSEKTGYQRPSITRLFSGKFAPHLDIIFCVLAAINELSGRHYSLKDVDATKPV